MDMGMGMAMAIIMGMNMGKDILQKKKNPYSHSSRRFLNHKYKSL
jgi:hypothetical protein